MTKYWIGVASLDNVKMERLVACANCATARLPHRLKAGDRIIYTHRASECAMARPFRPSPQSANSRSESQNPMIWAAASCLSPQRYVLQASDAPILSLLPVLSFTRDRSQWAYRIWGFDTVSKRSNIDLVIGITGLRR